MRRRDDGTARAVLATMMMCGAALLSIPWFLTPPAYLDLVVQDAVFASDLSSRPTAVIQNATGKLVRTVVQKIGNQYVARIGRVDSGPGAFTVQVDGFRKAVARINPAPLQQVRAGVSLTPAFGRLEITPVNALVADQPIAAMVREGDRALAAEPRQLVTVDLPPGRRRLSAQAPGFCPADREIVVREGAVTQVRLPMSPDLQGDEIARFVLHWNREPRDLDAHYRKLGTTGTRNTAHAYFGHKEAADARGGAPFATLDVDERQPQGYETVTVRNTAEGDYEYYVHLYAGDGTIGRSGATVQVYTAGCRVKTLSAPPNCTQRVWNVANLRHSNGRVALLEQQRCEDGASLMFGGKAPVTLR